MDRSASREIHITGKVPRQSDPTGAAAVNVAALAHRKSSSKSPIARGSMSREPLPPISDEIRQAPKLRVP